MSLLGFKPFDLCSYCSIKKKKKNRTLRLKDLGKRNNIGTCTMYCSSSLCSFGFCKGQTRIRNEVRKIHKCYFSFLFFFFLSFNANSKILILFQSFDWLIRINREFKLFPGAGVMLLWVWSLVSWV